MELEILGYKHKIIIDSKKLRSECENWDYDPEVTQGLFCKYERQILVASDIDSEQILQTVLHETLHAIGSITGHEVLAHSTVKNELFVDALANGILNVLKNKEFYEFIGKALNFSRNGKREADRDGSNTFG